MVLHRDTNLNREGFYLFQPFLVVSPMRMFHQDDDDLAIFNRHSSVYYLEEHGKAMTGYCVELNGLLALK